MYVDGSSDLGTGSSVQFVDPLGNSCIFRGLKMVIIEKTDRRQVSKEIPVKDSANLEHLNMHPFCGAAKYCRSRCRNWPQPMIRRLRYVQTQKSNVPHCQPCTQVFTFIDQRFDTELVKTRGDATLLISVNCCSYLFSTSRSAWPPMQNQPPRFQTHTLETAPTVEIEWLLINSELNGPSLSGGNYPSVEGRKDKTRQQNDTERIHTPRSAHTCVEYSANTQLTRWALAHLVLISHGLEVGVKIK